MPIRGGWGGEQMTRRRGRHYQGLRCKMTHDKKVRMWGTGLALFVDQWREAIDCASLFSYQRVGLDGIWA